MQNIVQCTELFQFKMILTCFLKPILIACAKFYVFEHLIYVNLFSWDLLDIMGEKIT